MRRTSEGKPEIQAQMGATAPARPAGQSIACEAPENTAPQSGEGLAERLLAIGRDCAAHLPEEWRSIDHGELLFDEHGLPR